MEVKQKSQKSNNIFYNFNFLCNAFDKGKIDIDLVDEYGNTLMHLLFRPIYCQRDDELLKYFKLFLEYRIDLTIKNKDGKLAIHYLYNKEMEFYKNKTEYFYLLIKTLTAKMLEAGSPALTRDVYNSLYLVKQECGYWDKILLNETFDLHEKYFKYQMYDINLNTTTDDSYSSGESSDSDEQRCYAIDKKRRSSFCFGECLNI